jgi:hypothetical protein
MDHPLTWIFLTVTYAAAEIAAAVLPLETVGRFFMERAKNPKNMQNKLNLKD